MPGTVISVLIEALADVTIGVVTSIDVDVLADVNKIILAVVMTAFEFGRFVQSILFCCAPFSD